MSKIISVILFVTAFPFLVFAAESEILIGTPKPGSGVYAIEIRISTGNEEINAIEGQFFYDQDVLNIEKVITGESIVSAWLKEPKALNGSMTFSGIIPNGFKGKSGNIFSLHASAKKAGETSVNFSGKIYLNDGRGTGKEINLKSEKFNTVILKEPEALSSLNKDLIPPQILQSAISKNEAMFEGKPFIVVYAKDNESGIASYELALTDNNFLTEEILQNEEIPWRVFKSPSVLPEDFADKYVYIRVKDKEGNMVAKLISTPQEELSPFSPMALFRKWWGFGIIIILVFGGALTIRRLLRLHEPTYL